MELVTKKSACKGLTGNELVKSPKEAIRRTLKDTQVKSGMDSKLFPSAFVSKNGKYDSLWG